MALDDSDLVPVLRPPSPDFLEGGLPYSGQIAPDAIAIPDIVQAINLLTREIRKMHPSQRCVVSQRFEGPLGPSLQMLHDHNDFVECRFLSEGKPVKSQYVIVSNNSTASDIEVALNEPVIDYFSVGGDHGNGITLGTVGSGSAFFIHLPMELEFIQIRLKGDIVGATSGISVNNKSAAGSLVKGGISVYAWTIPSSATEEVSRNERHGITNDVRGNM